MTTGQFFSDPTQSGRVRVGPKPELTRPVDNPLPTTHFHSSSYLFHQSSLLLTSLFFLFLLFHFCPALHFTPPSSPTVLTPNQHLHHHFSGKITGKFLWTHKHLHIFFFEVKIYNHFCGFYTFAWGYFYLSFNNNTHVIYEHWKWYLCVFIHEFCICEIICWVGI